MRVADLIGELMALDQDAEVVMYDPDASEYLPIRSVHLDPPDPEFGIGAEVYFDVIAKRPVIDNAPKMIFDEEENIPRQFGQPINE